MLFSLLLITLVSLFWAHPGTTIAQGDRPPLLDPLNEISSCPTAWTNTRALIGEPAACFGYTNYLLVYWVATSLFGASYGQVLTAALILGLSWLGAYYCARALGVSSLPATVVAWAFAFSPARQNSLLILPSFDVTFAVVPWLFFLLLRGAAAEGRARSTLWVAAIAAVVGPILAVTPQLILEIVIGYIAWLPLAASFSQERRTYYVWATRTFGIAALVSVWWAVPSAYAFLAGHVTHSVSLNQSAWVYAHATLLNELRFLATWQWYDYNYTPWGSIIERVPLLYVSAFVSVFGSIGALVTARGRELHVARYCCALALILLFLAKGMHPPFAILNEWFFKLPAMFLFLEPFGAITIAALCLAVCLGVMLDALFLRFALSNKILGPVAAATALCAVFLSGLPILTGALFHEASGFEPSMHVRVPGYWLEMAEHLNRTGAAGGVLLLPPDTSYQVNYGWGYYGADSLARDLIHREVFVPGVVSGYVGPAAQLSIDKRFLAMIAAKSALTVPVLRDLGVRYVLFRGDAQDELGFPMSSSQASSLFAAFARQRFGPLDLYDLGPIPSPLTSATTVVLERSATALDAGNHIELRSLEERLPRVGGRGPADLARLTTFTESEIPGDRLASRVLWRPRAGLSVGSYSSIESQLRAAYELDQSPNATLTLPYSSFQRLSTDIGVPIPRVIGSGADERTHSFEVLNPSAHAIYCEMSIGTRERNATIFGLYVNHRMVDRRDVPASPVPRWLRFQQMRLLPGPNLVELSVYPGTPSSYGALLPPRAITGGAWDPFEGQIKFDNIRIAEKVPSLPSISTRGPGVVVEVPALDGPSLLFEGGESIQGRTVGVLLNVRLRDSRYQCYDRIFLDTPADLNMLLRQCFEVTGQRLDDEDMRHLSLVSLSLFPDPSRTPKEGSPFKTLRVSFRVRRPLLVEVGAPSHLVRFVAPALQAAVFERALPRNPDVTLIKVIGPASDVSMLAAGRPRARFDAERDVPLLFHFGGLYVGRIEHAGVQIIAMRDLYHPTWLAVTLMPGFHVLQHFQVDGWRNAWLADRNGLFIAVNGLVVFQIIFAAFALSVLVYLWRVMR